MTEWLHFHFSLSCTGEGNGNPLQCSCLENPRDGGTWWAAVSRVAQSRTRLKRLSSSSSMVYVGFSGGASGKEPSCQCRRLKGCGLDPWVGRIPWRNARQPTPGEFLPGEFPQSLGLPEMPRVTWSDLAPTYGLHLNGEKLKLSIQTKGSIGYCVNKKAEQTEYTPNCIRLRGM